MCFNILVCDCSWFRDTSLKWRECFHCVFVRARKFRIFTYLSVYGLLRDTWFGVDRCLKLTRPLKVRDCLPAVGSGQSRMATALSYREWVPWMSVVCPRKCRKLVPIWQIWMSVLLLFYVDFCKQVWDARGGIPWIQVDKLKTAKYIIMKSFFNSWKRFLSQNGYLKVYGFENVTIAVLRMTFEATGD